MKYLNSFSSFLENSFVPNKKTHDKGVPEISDTRNFGGAYGISDVWLELLK